MDNTWHRFTYWLEMNWPSAVQAVSAVATVALTAALAWFTRKYIELTAELAASAQRQTMILAQPNLDITSEVRSIGAGAGHRYYEAHVTLHNKGAYPVLVKRVTVGWQVEGPQEFVEHDLLSLRNSVIPAGKAVHDRLRVDEGVRDENSLGPFSDFLATTVRCEDLTALCPCEYRYQPAKGLVYTSLKPEAT